MSDLVFQALDGLQVTLEDRRYRYHIYPKHPDVSVEDIREALTKPVRICNHRTKSDRRIYEGPARADYFGVQHFVIVVVGLIDSQRGRVLTAYRETLHYLGVQRWP